MNDELHCNNEQTPPNSPARVCVLIKLNANQTCKNAMHSRHADVRGIISLFNHLSVTISPMA